MNCIPPNFRYTGRQKITSAISGAVVMVEYRDDNPGPGNRFWYQASQVVDSAQQGASRGLSR